MTVLQSLPKTIGLSSERMRMLDTLRRKRNLSDYTGEGIDDVSTDHCIHEAEQLLNEVKTWLMQHRPGLV